MITKDVGYTVNGKTFTGYLANDETRGGKRPGVLVCHQGNGLGDHAKERARMLAALGYVAFALDLYGERPGSIEDANRLMNSVIKDPKVLQVRVDASLAVLADQPDVDTKRLAAIGYCFGGAVVLEMARYRPDLGCVVSFHPGLAWQPDRDDRKIAAKVMLCAGVEDPLIPAEAREKFIGLMVACGADWQLLTYGKAGHSFTDKSVDALNMRGFAYNEAADRRSWAAMLELFGETIGRV